jgi:hypothetical protein
LQLKKESSTKRSFQAYWIPTQNNFDFWQLHRFPKTSYTAHKFGKGLRLHFGHDPRSDAPIDKENRVCRDHSPAGIFR